MGRVLGGRRSSQSKRKIIIIQVALQGICLPVHSAGKIALAAETGMTGGSAGGSVGEVQHVEKLGITAKSRLQYQHTPPASHTGGRERCEQAEGSVSTWPMEVREWAGMLGLSETCPGPWSTQPASAPKSNVCGISYIQQVFAEHEDQRITLVLQIQQRTTQVKLSSLSALM